MKVKSESEVAQLCPTLRDPMDCSLPGSSVHGILQASALEWGGIEVDLTNFKYNLISPGQSLVEEREKERREKGENTEREEVKY